MEKEIELLTRIIEVGEFNKELPINSGDFIVTKLSGRELQTLKRFVKVLKQSKLYPK